MKAFQVFEEYSKFAGDEKSYFMFKDQAMNTIRGYYSTFKKQNDGTSPFFLSYIIIIIIIIILILFYSMSFLFWLIIYRAYWESNS